MNTAKRTGQPTIGFDRRIRLTWLGATAAESAQGLSPGAIRDKLESVLADEVVGSGVHNARGKTKTILLHVWVLVPEHLEQFRDDALHLFLGLDRAQQKALHWGMLLATYPFFRDVATLVGRLIELQGTVALSQLQRRVAEVWGERTTIQRAVPPVLKSMADWGVLEETARAHVYRSAPRIGQVSPAIREWLVEALYLARGDRVAPFQDLVHHPALFPFDLAISPASLYRHPRLEVVRLGLDQDVVTRRELQRHDEPVG
ncbi:MAG TPA: hypothetical protein VNL16_19610 [Chloroflexota bacterium]|nr:hypothetical protein [Chloroflexota bacterium]